MVGALWIVEIDTWWNVNEQLHCGYAERTELK